MKLPARALLLTLALPLAAGAVHAQIAPDLHWETIATEHFRVHFSPGLDSIARRAAGSAERAYGRLARELHEPRGPIELVVADNQDVSNGFTTTFPTNHITIFARPPVDVSSLRFDDDWIDFVVTHELTHVFHLDRSRGWWRVGQFIFGRNPFLFPGLYYPSWVDEGIAVYYESRLTGAGRELGTDFATTARAQSVAGNVPSLNALSAATLAWPFGGAAYTYGGLLMNYLAQSRGDGAMRAYIETSAARTVPFLLNTNARAAFGVTFDSAFTLWRDSTRRAALRPVEGAVAARELTAVGWFAQRVRWMDDGHIAYEANDGRDVSSLSVVATSGGSPSRLARRNSLDVTSLLPDGSRVFAQLEFTDPYTIRSDLYLERRGATARLTFGARLLQPDAKESRTGAISIVAVQVLPGAARLVRVDVHAGVRGSPVLAPITDATPDTLWSDPRWSHDGARIVATRWLHGGLSDIVVLDAAGRVVTSFGRSRSVNGEPSWARGDSAVYFTSDRSGRAALYRASVSTGAVVRVADSQTGLVESEESPDGSQLATTIIRGDGYHVAVMPVGALTAVADAGSVLSPSRNDPIVASAAPSKTYSPWASLRPYYWLPGIDQTDDGRTSYGFITTGTDALYRHAYTVDATYEPRRHEPSAALSYQYAGLGNPVLGVTGQEIWDHYQIQETSQQNPATNQVIGTLDRRRYLADIAFTFLRPRVRTNAYLTLGGEMEWRDYRTDPAPLMDSLDASFRQAYTYPSLYLMAGWSNVRQPVLAISGEDGIALNATLRERWRTDNAADTRSTSVVGSGSAYKSLDFAGFAHHVIALRGAAGWEDEHATNEFDAGGVPGSSLSIAPGVNVGDAPRTFPVRGFPGGAQQGIRALAGSMEYRAPIALPDAGYKMLPLFLQRVSASLFGDAGTSWCPAGAAGSPICPLAGTPRIWMGSVGAELNVDAALEYDTPYRFRLGVATPVAGRQYFGRSNVAWYVTAGLSF